MEDSIGALVPIVFIVLLLGGWIVGRVMKHRERMEMLRMGIIPPRDLKRWQKHGGPGWAQSMQGMQMPPGMPMPPNSYQPYDEQLAAQFTLQRGIRTTMVGLAITIGFSFIGYDSSSFPPIHPGPWLLGGLIPMFFGVAQIINALLAGATIGARLPQPPPPYGSDAPKPPPQQPGHPFSGFSEPGRPGPRYEELARPVPPPDRTN